MAYRSHHPFGRALLAVLLLILVLPVQAREWKVENELRGKPDKDKLGAFHKAQDVSGLRATAKLAFRGGAW